MKTNEEIYNEEDLDDEDIEEFQRELEEYDIEPIKESFDDKFEKQIHEIKRESTVSRAISQAKKREVRKVREGY